VATKQVVYQTHNGVKIIDQCLTFFSIHLTNVDRCKKFVAHLHRRIPELHLEVKLSAGGRWLVDMLSPCPTGGKVWHPSQKIFNIYVEMAYFCGFFGAKFCFFSSVINNSKKVYMYRVRQKKVDP